MSSWLLTNRVEDFDRRLHEAADGLVIDLGHDKVSTSLSSEADELEEVCFDGEVVCEEHAIDADYTPIDLLTMIAITDMAVFLVDDGSYEGEKNG